MNKQLKIAAMMMVLSGAGLVCHAQQSQTISFFYDRNGNRIAQEISTSNKNENRETVDEDIPFTSTILDFCEAMRVSLYPNPTRDKLTLSVKDKPEGLALTFKLTTSTGLVLQEKVFSGDHETFDVSNLPAGIYLFQLIANDRKHIWKFIKE